MLKDFVDTANAWAHTYMWWLIAGEVLGGLLVIGSIAVASMPPFLLRIVDVKNLAFIVAALAAVNTFIDPTGRAERYGVAVTNLVAAIDDYNTAIDDAARRMALTKVVQASTDGMRSIRAQAVARKVDKELPHGDGAEAHAPQRDPKLDRRGIIMARAVFRRTSG